jgi:hypothetical protein
VSWRRVCEGVDRGVEAFGDIQDGDIEDESTEGELYVVIFRSVHVEV